jgi:hypothetical protein
VAVVLGPRDGALVVVAGEVAAVTMEEVPDPRAAEAMEEEVVVAEAVVAGAVHARICGSGRGQARPADF